MFEEEFLAKTDKYALSEIGFAGIHIKGTIPYENILSVVKTQGEDIYKVVYINEKGRKTTAYIPFLEKHAIIFENYIKEKVKPLNITAKTRSFMSCLKKWIGVFLWTLGIVFLIIMVAYSDTDRVAIVLIPFIYLASFIGIDLMVLISFLITAIGTFVSYSRKKVVTTFKKESDYEI